MSFTSKDEQILHKIKKYLSEIRMCFPDIVALGDSDLECNKTASHIVLCVMQLYELSDSIDNTEVRDRLRGLRTKQVRMFRNIAAHDYGSFNWQIGKKTCKELIETITEKEMDDCLSLVSLEKLTMKDYTTENK